MDHARYNKLRFAYVVDGEIRHTGVFETTHTDPRRFAAALARLKDAQFDGADVHVWMDPDADPATVPADAVEVAP